RCYRAGLRLASATRVLCDGRRAGPAGGAVAGVRPHTGGAGHCDGRLAAGQRTGTARPACSRCNGFRRQYGLASARWKCLAADRPTAPDHRIRLERSIRLAPRLAVADRVDAVAAAVFRGLWLSLSTAAAYRLVPRWVYVTS